MFELVTNAYAQLTWGVYTVWKIQTGLPGTFTDPGTFISGAVAGAVGRAVVVPFDQGGNKGALQAIWRRMPQYGLLMMMYCSTASRALKGKESDPSKKLMATFLVGSLAGLNMRLICNPISRVADECLRTGHPAQQVIRNLKNKTILQFWYCQPNLIANALYIGVLFTVFEGMRRFTERNYLPLAAPSSYSVVPSGDGLAYAEEERRMEQNYLTTAAIHGCLGGAAAAVASTVCYPYSAHSYLQTVIHDSALCRGLGATLLKEVPMMAVTFGTFSLLQPFLAPRHGRRCGFGY